MDNVTYFVSKIVLTNCKKKKSGDLEKLVNLLRPLEQFIQTRKCQFIFWNRILFGKDVVKVFNWSEVHLSEMTCYKIHTLGVSQI